MKIKAIVVKNPDAALIRAGRKTVETRTWSTNYRGALLIVAAKTDNLERMARYGRSAPEEDFFRGRAVAIVYLANCTAMNEVHESAAYVSSRPGLYAWTLTDTMKIRPFVVRGRLGFFDVEVPEEALR
jgi:hypothetical protein